MRLILLRTKKKIISTLPSSYPTFTVTVTNTTSLSVLVYPTIPLIHVYCIYIWTTRHSPPIAIQKSVSPGSEHPNYVLKTTPPVSEPVGSCVSIDPLRALLCHSFEFQGNLQLLCGLCLPPPLPQFLFNRQHVMHNLSLYKIANQMTSRVSYPLGEPPCSEMRDRYHMYVRELKHPFAEGILVGTAKIST